jgi:molybdenum cofactor cytidylyltransferase
MVYLMSDLDLPMRGRTYREPDGPHVTIVRGRDLDAALDHLDARPDCRALAVVGLPPELPDLSLLAGRRLLVNDPDRPRVRDFVQAGLEAGADPEWLISSEPELDRIVAWALPVGALILAAGMGTRMGRNKLLLDVGGQPLVKHVIDAAAEGGCYVVNVVYSDEAVRERIGSTVACVANPDASSGQASSIRIGLQSLPEELAGALIMLGDQPLVGSRTVAMLLRAWRREGARPATAATYGSAEGWRPPLVVDRSLWPDLMELQGDEGARVLFRERPDLLDTVLSGGRPEDVDTPEDYANIVRLFRRSDSG